MIGNVREYRQITDFLYLYLIFYMPL